MSSRISNFLYAICILFLPGVSFTTESVAGSNNVNEEDEETNISISGTTVSSELPLSIVHEILLRLPHKSFIRCKCVCKSWFNLISDPYFTRAYFANPPFTAVVLFQRGIVNNMSFRFLEIDDSNGDVTCAPFNPRALDFPVNGTDLDLRGSCNGLLCITQTLFDNVAVVYVINPLLGEFIMLPPVGFHNIMGDDYVPYGFGCSRYTNRYKVLRVAQNRITREVHGEILTVGVDEKWRSFKDASLTMDLIHDGVAMNGAVHFIGDVDQYVLGDDDQILLNDQNGFILAFDVEEERGRYINLPPGLKDKPSNFHLAVWNDKLCFNDNYSDTQVDIWTMKEYGVVESWSKEIILRSWVPVDLHPYALDPITTLRNKDLLMSRESRVHTQVPHLTSYNPTVKMCAKHEVAGVDIENVELESLWFAYVPNVIPLMDNLLGGGSQLLGTQ